MQRRAFNITLARTYKWETEYEVEQEHFLKKVVPLFREITAGKAQLRLVGFEAGETQRGAAAIELAHWLFSEHDVHAGQASGWPIFTSFIDVRPFRTEQILLGVVSFNM